MPGNLSISQLLAEVQRLQRWAGGDSVSAARIYGLMHGFESIIDSESERFGISRETQTKVEDILEEIDHGKQSAEWKWIKDRLHSDGIVEEDANRVMELCRLQSRSTNVLDQIAEEQGEPPNHLRPERLPEHDWFGALHYVELAENSPDPGEQSHAVLSPNVPRES